MPRPSLLLLPMLVAACSMGPAPEPSPAPPPPAAPMGNMAPAPAATFPVGTYTTTVAESDVPASVSADIRAAIIGAWEITFGSNGHAMVMFNGRHVVDSPFTVSGDEITFTQDSGDYACNSTARYRWHATATELHFTKIEDACDGRPVALTSHALVRKP